MVDAQDIPWPAMRYQNGWWDHLWYLDSVARDTRVGAHPSTCCQSKRSTIACQEWVVSKEGRNDIKCLFILLLVSRKSSCSALESLSKGADKRNENYVGSETLSTSIKERSHLDSKTVCAPHHSKTEKGTAGCEDQQGAAWLPELLCGLTRIGKTSTYPYEVQVQQGKLRRLGYKEPKCWLDCIGTKIGSESPSYLLAWAAVCNYHSHGLGCVTLDIKYATIFRVSCGALVPRVSRKFPSSTCAGAGSGFPGNSLQAHVQEPRASMSGLH
eukprot:1154964-Pelagomonas_calceolata.AAC.6